MLRSRCSHGAPIPRGLSVLELDRGRRGALITLAGLSALPSHPRSAMAFRAERWRRRSTSLELQRAQRRRLRSELGSASQSFAHRKQRRQALRARSHQPRQVRRECRRHPADANHSGRPTAAAGTAVVWASMPSGSNPDGAWHMAVPGTLRSGCEPASSSLEQRSRCRARRRYERNSDVMTGAFTSYARASIPATKQTAVRAIGSY